MELVVQKFGGSSVSTAKLIKNVANRIAYTYDSGKKVVVVVSARGDTTDDLISQAAEITSDISRREMDVLLATGEQQSIALLTMALHSRGKKAVSLTGYQAGILTDKAFSRARIRQINEKKINSYLDEGYIVIVAGFQGFTNENDITTLGRGGSDTTAVALAAGLGASVCEIYTDVDGVYTTDPRLEPMARKISVISYQEMLQMASCGAVVLHPRSVELAWNYQIPVHVRSSFNREEGTMVKEVNYVERTRISGIAYDTKIAKITIDEMPVKTGAIYKLFSQLADEHIPFDMVTQSGRSGMAGQLSFLVQESDLRKALETAKKTAEILGVKDINFEKEVAKVSLVGIGLSGNPSITAQLFEALAYEYINIEMLSSSEVSISFLIQKERLEAAIRTIHRKFNLDKEEANVS